jgi:hypothetical protein
LNGRVLAFFEKDERFQKEMKQVKGKREREREREREWTRRV